MGESHVVPAAAIASARYVTVKMFCSMTGWSEKAVYNKRALGIWLDGKVFIKKGGSLLIDMEGYNAWVVGDESAPQA